MSKKRYSIKAYDFVREWGHDVKKKTGLTKAQVLKQVEKILDKSTAPKIEIQLWRDSA